MIDKKVWYYYPIDIPLNHQGDGPVSYKECTSVSYEVWDQSANLISTHESLLEAAEEASRLNKLHKVQGW